MRAAGLLALALVGCAHRPPRGEAERPTVLVLSVGGADGVAHLGAIAALKEAGVPVTAVVGNSMGALVGALYASAPAEDTEARLQRLLRSYEAATRRETLRNGVAAGVLLGAAAAVATHGQPLAALVAGGGGFLLGAGATAELDHGRLVRAMRETFAGARIEALPIPFVTWHQRLGGAGVEMIAVRTGDLADAVGASLANPLLFPDVEVREGAVLDPGTDRAAATPIDDACRLFPGALLLAVNVTGRPALASGTLPCPVREVRLTPAGLGPRDMLSARGRQAIVAAHDAMLTTLRGRAPVTKGAPGHL